MNPLEISPAEFRELAQCVSELAARYLEALPTLPSFPARAGAEVTREAFDTPLPRQGLGPQALDGLQDVFDLSRAPVWSRSLQ